MLTSKELRIPETTTQEDLEYNWRTVLSFSGDVLLAGYFYQGPGQPSYFAARYRHTTEFFAVDDPLELVAIGPRFFIDEGHAIAWAINNCLGVEKNEA